MSNSRATMLDHTDEDKARANALRDAEYAPLTKRVVTEIGHALIADVYQRIMTYEAGTRKRKRGGKAAAFVRTLEGFVGDLLWTLGRKGHAAAWVYRSVTPRSFTNEVVTFRDFDALRRALAALGLVEEKPAVVMHWTDFGDGPFPTKRFTTRFRATPQLQDLATTHGISAHDADDHFIQGPPEHPLVLKGHSRREPERGYKIPGKTMKFACKGGLAAMEQTIKDLNTFIDQFPLRGGTHRGYIRVFNLGDHPAFKWDLGGRLYSLGEDSYQQMGSAERVKMTIDGKAVCELDIKASYLTIFHAQAGQPLDFNSNPDPYQLPELTTTPRDVVKAFITATFGNGQFPDRWSRKAVSDYRAETGVSLDERYPFAEVREAVAAAYPLLAELRQDKDKAQPPIWARLMYLESEALFLTMMALKDVGVPSLSVHDSLIVPLDSAQRARASLSGLYSQTTGATPCIVSKFLELQEEGK